MEDSSLHFSPDRKGMLNDVEWYPTCPKSETWFVTPPLLDSHGKGTPSFLTRGLDDVFILISLYHKMYTIASCHTHYIVTWSKMIFLHIGIIFFCQPKFIFWLYFRRKFAEQVWNWDPELVPLWTMLPLVTVLSILGGNGETILGVCFCPSYFFVVLALYYI